MSALVYNEIRLRSGSVWPAVLMHGTGNTLANSLLGSAGTPVVMLMPGWAWLGTFGVDGVLMMVSFALLGGVLYTRRRERPARAVPANQTA